MGAIEGAMGAIQSNTNNYYCSTNTTAAQQNIQSMSNYISVSDYNDAVTQAY